MHLRPCVLLTPLLAIQLAAQAKDARPHITSAADLPRTSYVFNGTTEQLLLLPKLEFLAFAAPVAAEASRLEAQYRIDDPATESALLETQLNVALTRGDDPKASLALIDRIRTLQDKPAEKLARQLGAEIYLRAEQAGGPPSPGTCPATLPAQYARALQKLPWEAAAPAITELRSRNNMVSQAFLVGLADSRVGPDLSQRHALNLQEAQFVLSVRALLVTMVPCKAATLAALAPYVAAHQLAKPDIWAAREIVLPAAGQLTPVHVAIWDSGIDLSLFPGRLYTNPTPKPDEDAHGFAFDVDAERTHGSLIPLTLEQQTFYSETARAMEGGADLSSGLDTPAAEALQQQLASMSPSQSRTFFDRLDVIGAYVHGTHVAGIAARDNPAIRLSYARMTFDTGNPHQPPSEAHSRHLADSFTQSVAWFKAHGVRVVNMSWWDRPSNFETDLAANGIGRNDEERKEIARHLFTIERDALFAAIQGAPDILFVTIAGNNDANNAFEECIPSSFVLPNLIVAGAVDQAGETTSFTSYGDNVAVYANGFAVPSTVPGGAVVKDTGTSMAAPQVTNLAAKLLALDPALTPPEVIDLIRRGSTPTPDGKRNLIDPARSAQLRAEKRIAKLDMDQTRISMTALRDSFVQSVRDAGFACPIAAPSIMVEDVPSFGSYDPETNSLRTSAWSLLKLEERQMFYRFMGPEATEAVARKEFEDGVHHWVIVHELGHWFQACRGMTSKTTKPYAIEFGADRIAAAYWNEHSPEVIAHQRPVFQAILQNFPNPVPQGEEVEPYFNAHYQELGPTPGYLWFQSRMCLSAFDESPTPSFKRVLTETK